ncbi:MAG TPA: hypothetical protein VK308_02630 [Pyrinomonadaceae bacterium]|nr:hypothetical protein [Pyrinomonadaceae bacterium]
MRLLLFYISLFFISPFVAVAQTPPDACRVTTSTWSLPEKIGTGIYELGWFQPVAFDNETTKHFKHEQSGLIVSVGVEYGDFRAAEKGKPIAIRGAIAVSDKEQDALSSVDGVAARTTYGKKWGLISVEKQVAAGNLVYNFAITCNDGRIKRKSFS